MEGLLHLTTDHVLVLVFAVVYPAYGAWAYPELLARIDAGQPDARVRTYARVIVVQWTLVGAALYWWARCERPWSELGLSSPSGPRLWIAAAMVGTLTALAAIQLRRLARKPESRRDVRRHLEQSPRLRGVFPRTRQEYGLFLLVSLTAGICEEILFRGYLIAYVRGFGPGPVVAGIVCGAWFGLAHAYQGPAGVLKTGVLGLVLVGGYLWTESLWVPMALHVLIDVHGGTVGWLAFRSPKA